VDIEPGIDKRDNFLDKCIGYVMKFNLGQQAALQTEEK
jgi:hypothetical protein